MASRDGKKRSGRLIPASRARRRDKTASSSHPRPHLTLTKTKKMSAKIIFILCSCLTSFANSASTYDQRQTGDLNVQVDLRDLRIIALMKGGKEEYVDYDYAYDYSEMTIKPQNGTTPKPLNGTSTVADGISYNSTAAAPVVTTEQTIFTLKINNSQNFETTEAASYSINESSLTTIKTVETSTSSTTVATEIVESSTIKDVSSTSRPLASNSTSCKKGFVLNQKGDCELKIQGAGNALLKLVKLSQKLKLRRENRGSQETKLSTI